MTPEQERIERLERALLELVYWGMHPDDNAGAETAWRTDWMVDTDVTDIIGDLLDKYKPTKEAE